MIPADLARQTACGLVPLLDHLHQAGAELHGIAPDDRMLALVLQLNAELIEAADASNGEESPVPTWRKDLLL